jgi:outer membrane receptor for ferrienterochelin and colicin
LRFTSRSSLTDQIGRIVRRDVCAVRGQLRRDRLPHRSGFQARADVWRLQRRAPSARRLRSDAVDLRYHRRSVPAARRPGQGAPPDDASFTLGGLVSGYHNDTGGRSNGELGPQEDDIRERAISANVAATWTIGGTTKVEARGYVSTYSERADGRLGPPQSTPLTPGALDEQYGKADLAVSHPIGSRQMLQGGLEWSRDHYEGTNRVRDETAGHQADTAVLWAQHRWSLTNRVTTTVGARVDRRSQFETAASPKAAASVRVTHHLHARISYGRGFRAPDLGQLYYRS